MVHRLLEGILGVFEAAEEVLCGEVELADPDDAGNRCVGAEGILKPVWRWFTDAVGSSRDLSCFDTGG
jgi:hypothetical protein